MKIKKILISLIAILMCIILSQCVYATGSIITIGESEAQIGENKQLTVKLSSSDTIGIISGRINGNENIQIISVSGRNNWNLTYNSETGVFNIYKAEGSKEEDIMIIQYKTVSENATGKITISNLKATSIDYETENLSNAEKNIEIKGSVEVQEEIIENDGNEEETGDVDNYEDLSLENSSDVESKQTVNVNKITVANKTLPKTGEFNIIIPIIILCISLVSIVIYIKYNNLKDVK